VCSSLADSFTSASTQSLWRSHHGDTFECPPDSVLLATSELYPQAFKKGSCLAFQFHPEASHEIFSVWIGRSRLLAAAGVDAGAVLAQSLDAGAEAERRGIALLTAWARQL
jgi:GMP synthase-like glutamine amidotransferase